MALVNGCKEDVWSGDISGIRKAFIRRHIENRKDVTD